MVTAADKGELCEIFGLNELQSVNLCKVNTAILRHYLKGEASTSIYADWANGK